MYRSMFRFAFGVLLSLLVFPGVAATNPGSGAIKPNLLLIVADDLGYADVGFNGNKTVATPNLDKLAAEGVNLTGFRACPVCSPTRAGLLTGRWPIRFGLMNAVVPPWSTNGLPAAEKTLAELLAPAGYAQRAIVGKWHLGHARKEFLPLSQGFTRFYGHYNGAVDYFDHSREQETDWHDNWRTVRVEGYATDLLGAEAARLIRRAPPGEPWLLYLSFNAPHSPFQAKPELIEHYRKLGAPRPVYAAMIHSMDQAIGQVLAAVGASSNASNTLVLFFSDNGGIPRAGGSNRPWPDGKFSVYEGGTRVCAAIRWPAGGLVGGRHFDGLIGYIDVLPTLLAAANIPAPENLDGINFLPALRGDRDLPDRSWFSYIHQDENARASVHSGPWKLVAGGDFFSESPAAPTTVELYNLKQDPRETTNLAASQTNIVARLRRELQQFGRLQTKPGLPYTAGRAGFRAPKNWIIDN